MVVLEYEQILEKVRILESRASELLPLRETFQELTVMESQVLEAYLSGFKSSEIGIQNNVTTSHVSRTIKRIEEKLGKNRRNWIAYSLQHLPNHTNAPITLFDWIESTLQQMQQMQQMLEEVCQVSPEIILSRLERKILKNLFNGLKGREIAVKRNVTTSHVSRTIQKIESKLGKDRRRWVAYEKKQKQH